MDFLRGVRNFMMMIWLVGWGDLLPRGALVGEVVAGEDELVVSEHALREELGLLQGGHDVAKHARRALVNLVLDVFQLIHHFVGRCR